MLSRRVEPSGPSAAVSCSGAEVPRHCGSGSPAGDRVAALHPAVTLTIRWTLGAVSDYGLDALAFSIQGARSAFGPSAHYVVCVNRISLAHARLSLGAVARQVEWRDSNGDLPGWLKPCLDDGMAEGVAWKFAPPRLSLEDYVLTLDNDVILWRMPSAIEQWLADGDSLLIAEDVLACYGQFSRFCPEAARNSGIIGLPPATTLSGSSGAW